MTLTGTFRNGFVVPDEPEHLKEGARVQIILEPNVTVLKPGSREALKEFFRTARAMNSEEAAEWERLEQDVARMREEDLVLETQRRREHTEVAENVAERSQRGNKV